MTNDPVEYACRVADQLADPVALTHQSGRIQSLSHGTPGVTLLHIELAAGGLRPWSRIEDWLTHVTRTPITRGRDSHLFHGAPALAHTISCAAAIRPGRYQRAADTLHAAVTADARQRIETAQARIDQGDLTDLAEYDVIRGLTGIGAYLLHHDPTGDITRAVLSYVVTLTEPVTAGGDTLPGWWTRTGPSGRPEPQFPGGHANNGMAHGIAGPLALLALAHQAGVIVDGHHTAIHRILQWLRQYPLDTATSTGWPYWLTSDELRTGRPAHRSPARPSWCYGTAGTARAMQLAALAVGDTHLQNTAELALIGALSDPVQRATVVDASLCHGHAGIALAASRMAHDANPHHATRLRSLLPDLLDGILAADRPHTVGLGAWGLLDGAAGLALTLLTVPTAGSRSGWDACLLTGHPRSRS